MGVACGVAQARVECSAVVGSSGGVEADHDALQLLVSGTPAGLDQIVRGALEDYFHGEADLNLGGIDIDHVANDADLRDVVELDQGDVVRAVILEGGVGGVGGRDV